MIIYCIQWTLVIKNSLGPVKLLCYRNFVISGLQKQYNTKKFWTLDQEKYFIIWGFCYISVLYNEIHCIWKAHACIVPVVNLFKTFCYFFNSYKSQVHVYHENGNRLIIQRNLKLPVKPRVFVSFFVFPFNIHLKSNWKLMHIPR